MHTPPADNPRGGWPRVAHPTPLSTLCQCGSELASHAARWPHRGMGCTGFVPAEALVELSAQLRGADHKRRWICAALRCCGPSALRFALPYSGRLSLQTDAVGASAVDVGVYQGGILIASWMVVGEGTRTCLVEVEKSDLVLRVRYADNHEARTTEPYGILPSSRARRARG